MYIFTTVDVHIPPANRKDLNSFTDQSSQGIKVLPPILVGLLAAQILLWTMTNRSYFQQRFFSRGTDGGAVEHDEDRLD